MTARTVLAWTAPGSSYPAYINISKSGCLVTIVARGPGWMDNGVQMAGETVTLHIPAHDFLPDFAGNAANIPGWKMVPREPTPEMIDAWANASSGNGVSDWRVMYDAAPPFTQEGVGRHQSTSALSSGALGTAQAVTLTDEEQSLVNDFKQAQRDYPNASFASKWHNGLLAIIDRITGASTP